jgi:hypothetical protein
MEPLKANSSGHDDAFVMRELSAGCTSWQRFHRRRLLNASACVAGGMFGGGLLTHVAEKLARAQEKPHPKSGHAKSLIVLWLQGGPSQLETFDPHAGSSIGGDTKAIETSVAGIQFADTLPQAASLMHFGTLIRSMVSREGDHERATYNMKTGWRPDPTLVHPSLGAVVCHQSPNNIEIPRHVSILSGQWPARGGYMGNAFDAFQMGDPRNPLPNLKSFAPPKEFEKRVTHLQDVVEREFRRGRIRDMDKSKTFHESSTQNALTMMASEQIKAFDVALEGNSIRATFGDTAFGRGCLAAVRLVDAGVRCVEVELSGWDSHIDNHDIQAARSKVLDAALYGLLNQLHDRGLLESTVVMCGGEFGRTPAINVTGGRDHWATGYSVLLAGGPFRRGHVHGGTTHEPIEKGTDPLSGVRDPVPVEDLHATVLHALGVDFTQEQQTPIGRPMALSQGKVIHSLFA